MIAHSGDAVRHGGPAGLPC